MARGIVNVSTGTTGSGNGLPIVEAFSTDGVTYTATVDGLAVLKTGYSITIIPNMESATRLPELDLNGLGAARIAPRASATTKHTATPAQDNWLQNDRPVTLTYVESDGVDEACWLTSFAEAGSGVRVYTATIGTEWTDDVTTGVKFQTVPIADMTADMTAKVDVVNTHERTSEGYAAFVAEKNQFLDCITNGDAETVEGGIKFYIYGEANTVEIPIVVEVF